MKLKNSHKKPRLHLYDHMCFLRREARIASEKSIYEKLNVTSYAVLKCWLTYHFLSPLTLLAIFIIWSVSTGLIYNNITSIALTIWFSLTLFSYLYLAAIQVRLMLFDYKSLNQGNRIHSSLTDFPKVSVIIPSCNEPFNVAKMTFDSAISLDYPRDKIEIIVVDNSDADFEGLQAWKQYVQSSDKSINSRFIHREGRQGFKPRNIDIGIGQSSGEFVFFLDIDSTIRRSSLQRVLLHFELDPNLGYAQIHTLQTNAQGNSLIAKVNAIKLNLLRTAQGVRSHGGMCLFYGHNGIWRKKSFG